MSTKAIIYSRVASDAVLDGGNSINSQQRRCRAYAARKGYDVVQVFCDVGSSGCKAERPGIQALLQHLELDHANGPCAVVIDNISRLARSVETHLQLKAAIAELGGKLECADDFFE